MRMYMNEAASEENANYFTGQYYGVDENDIPRECYDLKTKIETVMKNVRVGQDYRQYGTCESCSICGKVVSNIKKHMKSHNPEQHKCPLCPIVLTRADNLKRHLRMKHCSVLRTNNTSNIQV